MLCSSPNAPSLSHECRSTIDNYQPSVFTDSSPGVSLATALPVRLASAFTRIRSLFGGGVKEASAILSGVPQVIGVVENSRIFTTGYGSNPTHGESNAKRHSDTKCRGFRPTFIGLFHRSLRRRRTSERRRTSPIKRE